MEIVVKGGTTYLKGPLSEEWTVLHSGAPIFANPSEFFPVEASKLGSMAVEGVEAVDGVDSYRVTATAPAGTYGLPKGGLKLSFWIGVDDALPRRLSLAGSIVMDSDEAGPLAALGSGAFSAPMVLSLSDFGKPVDIEAPDADR